VIQAEETASTKSLRKNKFNDLMLRGETEVLKTKDHMEKPGLKPEFSLRAHASS
jgi:hypothetical protein